MSKRLESLQSPADLAKFSYPELEELAGEIRGFLIEKVSKSYKKTSNNRK
jgi:deoxyxylulose-5-phosphate synthase